jgi:hypothetical protein
MWYITHMKFLALHIYPPFVVNVSHVNLSCYESIMIFFVHVIHFPHALFGLSSFCPSMLFCPCDTFTTFHFWRLYLSTFSLSFYLVQYVFAYVVLCPFYFNVFPFLTFSCAFFPPCLHYFICLLTLPYLTLPYLTLPYLTYLTPYLTLPLPYLTQLYLTLPLPLP